MPQLSAELLDAFATHSNALRAAARERREAMSLRAGVHECLSTTGECCDEEIASTATLGVPIRGETMRGDTNLRTLRTLLALVDERGFERSPHQLAFHSAFERCTARVIYKGEWAACRPQIMRRNGWDRCSSEVLISTPRRFGKTFSCVTLPHPRIPASPYAHMPACPHVRMHTRARTREPQDRHLRRVSRTELRLRARHLFSCTAGESQAVGEDRGVSLHCHAHVVAPVRSRAP